VSRARARLTLKDCARPITPPTSKANPDSSREPGRGSSRHQRRHPRASVIFAQLSSRTATPIYTEAAAPTTSTSAGHRGPLRHGRLNAATEPPRLAVGHESNTRTGCRRELRASPSDKRRARAGAVKSRQASAPGRPAASNAVLSCPAGTAHLLRKSKRENASDSEAGSLGRPDSSNVALNSFKSIRPISIRLPLTVRVGDSRHAFE
jgi:hypothetical protein